MKPSPVDADPADPRTIRRATARVAPTSRRLNCGSDTRTGPPPGLRASGGPAADSWVGRAAVGVVRLPFTVPMAAIGAGRGVWGWTEQLVELGVELPGRIQGLLDDVGRLVATAGEVVGDVQRIVAEVDEVLGGVRSTMSTVDVVVVEVRETRHGAEEVSQAARKTGSDVDELVALYEPLAREAAPLVQRFVDELASEEVDAAIKLVDQLPALTESMQSDILPILSTLDRVAPDLRELLDVAKDVRKAFDGIPGSGFLRKRGEAVDDERPDDRNG